MSLLRHRACFTLALLLFVVAMLAATPRLGRVARFVPLLVIAPTLALLIAQLALDLVPRFRGIQRNMERTRWLPLPERGMQGSREEECKQAAPREGESRPAAVRESRAGGRLGWTLLLPVTIYLLGFSAAIPLHTFVYLRWFSGERWRLSLAIPAGLYGLFFILARFVPTVSLWPGWIWMRLELL
jgi:hypothetical protein